VPSRALNLLVSPICPTLPPLSLPVCPCTFSPCSVRRQTHCLHLHALFHTPTESLTPSLSVYPCTCLVSMYLQPLQCAQAHPLPPSPTGCSPAAVPPQQQAAAAGVCATLASAAHPVWPAWWMPHHPMGDLGHLLSLAAAHPHQVCAAACGVTCASCCRHTVDCMMHAPDTARCVNTVCTFTHSLPMVPRRIPSMCILCC
jgi:hypothetical protein